MIYLPKIFQRVNVEPGIKCLLFMIPNLLLPLLDKMTTPFCRKTYSNYITIVESDKQWSKNSLYYKLKVALFQNLCSSFFRNNIGKKLQNHTPN